MNKSVVTLALAAILSACGGGGGSSTATTPPVVIPPTTVTAAKIIQVDESITIGQSIDLALFSPDEEVSNISWQQTAGEDITFYAANSKVIGFTPTVAGDYSFSVNYTNGSNEQKTLSYDFTVNQEKALLTTRLGHAVVEGNGVSIINYIIANESGNDVVQESIKWVQTAGPSVTFTDSATDGKVAVFFDAPSVTKDTLLQFSVSGDADGATYYDNISILVENSDVSLPAANSNTRPFEDRKADVFLYNPNSAAGQKLIDCVYSNKASYANSCTFGETPLIAQITSAPTVDDIMDRVVVSHQWMGDQFKKFLETYDSEHNDFKNLLRATTAVVISYDIRPSFYQPYTGAIYLDPSDLWETPAQRDTINQAPDFRAAFGSDLQFEMPWRYVKNNEYANYYSPIRLRLSRTLSNSLVDFASLLYHELAHSNDFFPSTRWNSYSSNQNFLNVVNSVYNAKEIQSDYLQRTYPLDELYASGGQNAMTKLGQVRFQGASVSDEQKAYTPDDIANMFKTETAPQFYSYSSTREDYAILFDAFMLKVRYGVSRDVAVSDQAYDQIFWGQRGRIGEENIKPRVEFVASRILPELTDVSQLVESLASPTPLEISKNWGASVVITGQNKTNIAAQILKNNNIRDPRLIPKDGINRHQPIQGFKY